MIKKKNNVDNYLIYRFINKMAAQFPPGYQNRPPGMPVHQMGPPVGVPPYMGQRNMLPQQPLPSGGLTEEMLLEKSKK